MDTEQRHSETAAKIAELNDKFRKSMEGCTVTRGVVAMGAGASEVFVSVRDFSAFTEDNDPYGEHDFGALSVSGGKIFWKIDYYDAAFSKWCDPLDERCHRHLTIMLAEEY